jgi:hypothetical protein
MNEVRRVIGVFDDLVAKKGDIEFPSVRVWIRGQNDFVTGELKEAFPTRATVFLHTSACDNEHPQLHQVGLFNCVRSKSEQSAHWMVETTSRRLAVIVDCRLAVEVGTEVFLRWIREYEEKNPCDILLGDSVAYVRTIQHALVGPFLLSEGGKLIIRGPTSIFRGVEVADVDVARRRHSFVDLDQLSKGEPVILDPADAILHRLRLIQHSQQFSWLSRDKARDLASALASIQDVDVSNGIFADLPAALALLCESGRDLDPKLIDALLEITPIAEAITTAWERKHADAVKKRKDEAERIQVYLTELKQKTVGAEVEQQTAQAKRASLEAKVSNLEVQIGAAKGEAKQIFDEELKRLAQSPATMAILAAWSGSGSAGDQRQLTIVEKPLRANEGQVSTLAEAIAWNLMGCGLSPRLADELSLVCQAALAAGQGISFRSLFAEILAECVASALGHPATLLVDVPAGLLDPIDWNSLLNTEQKGLPIVLLGANRSDIGLLLGSMRLAVFRQALGLEKSSNPLFLTLESREDMQVDAGVPLGPIIDEQLLKFLGPKEGIQVLSCTEYADQLPKIKLLSQEDFATSVGEEIVRLPLLSTSASELAFRRSFSSLQTFAPDIGTAARLFFKYWCFPRSDGSTIGTVFKARKEEWRQDEMLIQALEIVSREE